MKLESDFSDIYALGFVDESPLQSDADLVSLHQDARIIPASPSLESMREGKAPAMEAILATS